MSSNPPPLRRSARIQEIEAPSVAEAPQNPEPMMSPKSKKGCKRLQSNADDNASKCQKGEEDESMPADTGNDTVESQGQQNKGKGRKEMAKKGKKGGKRCVTLADLVAHTY